MDWLPVLVRALARRRAVVVIGSGVSANAKTDEGCRPPTWGQFLNLAYRGLGRRIPHIASAIARYSYLEACDYLKTEYNTEWAGFIREHFVRPQFRPSEIHKAIFDLDSRIVMSLNFDKIYENYAISISESTVVIKNYYDQDIRQTVAGTDRYIIKPHGSVDTISQMIFTLDDYARARVRNGAFYEVLTALLHTHIFFCIGCGLSDPDIKMMFEDYRYKFNEFPHFITLARPFSDQECALLQRTRGLNVLRYSPKDHHKELTQGLVELGKAVAEERDRIAELQDW